jgi:hypothetical protein
VLDPGGERAACGIGEPGAVVPDRLEARGGGERHARTVASAPDNPRRSVPACAGDAFAPLTLGRAFTAWRAEPGVLTAAAAPRRGYGWGLRRRAAGAAGPWSAVRLAADTLPARVRAPLARALHSRVARALTFPLVVTVVLVVPLLVLYLR